MPDPHARDVQALNRGHAAVIAVHFEDAQTKVKNEWATYGRLTMTGKKDIHDNLAIAIQALLYTTKDGELMLKLRFMSPHFAHYEGIINLREAGTVSLARGKLEEEDTYDDTNINVWMKSWNVDLPPNVYKVKGGGEQTRNYDFLTLSVSDAKVSRWQGTRGLYAQCLSHRKIIKKMKDKGQFDLEVLILWDSESEYPELEAYTDAVNQIEYEKEEAQFHHPTMKDLETAESWKELKKRGSDEQLLKDSGKRVKQEPDRSEYVQSGRNVGRLWNEIRSTEFNFDDVDFDDDRALAEIAGFERMARKMKEEIERRKEIGAKESN